MELKNILILTSIFVACIIVFIIIILIVYFVVIKPKEAATTTATTTTTTDTTTATTTTTTTTTDAWASGNNGSVSCNDYCSNEWGAAAFGPGTKYKWAGATCTGSRLPGTTTENTSAESCSTAPGSAIDCHCKKSDQPFGSFANDLWIDGNNGTVSCNDYCSNEWGAAAFGSDTKYKWTGATCAGSKMPGSAAENTDAAACSVAPGSAISCHCKKSDQPFGKFTPCVPKSEPATIVPSAGCAGKIIDKNAGTDAPCYDKLPSYSDPVFTSGVTTIATLDYPSPMPGFAYFKDRPAAPKLGPGWNDSGAMWTLPPDTVSKIKVRVADNSKQTCPAGYSTLSNSCFKNVSSLKIATLAECPGNTNNNGTTGCYDWSTAQTKTWDTVATEGWTDARACPTGADGIKRYRSGAYCYPSCPAGKTEYNARCYDACPSGYTFESGVCKSNTNASLSAEKIPSTKNYKCPAGTILVNDVCVIDNDPECPYRADIGEVWTKKDGVCFAPARYSATNNLAQLKIDYERFLDEAGGWVGDFANGFIKKTDCPYVANYSDHWTKKNGVCVPPPRYSITNNLALLNSDYAGQIGSTTSPWVGDFTNGWIKQTECPYNASLNEYWTKKGGACYPPSKYTAANDINSLYIKYNAASANTDWGPMGQQPNSVTWYGDFANGWTYQPKPAVLSGYTCPADYPLLDSAYECHKPCAGGAPAITQNIGGNIVAAKCGVPDITPPSENRIIPGTCPAGMTNRGADICWADADSMKMQCKDGYEEYGGYCYAPCSSYGPEWGNSSSEFTSCSLIAGCPPSYTDNGLLCGRTGTSLTKLVSLGTASPQLCPAGATRNSAGSCVLDACPAGYSKNSDNTKCEKKCP